MQNQEREQAGKMTFGAGQNSQVPEYTLRLHYEMGVQICVLTGSSRASPTKWLVGEILDHFIVSEVHVGNSSRGEDSIRLLILGLPVFNLVIKSGRSEDDNVSRAVTCSLSADSS